MNRYPSFFLALTVVFGMFAQAQPSALRALGVDSSQATIPVGDILSGGPPPQGIPALGFSGDWFGAAEPSPEATFVGIAEAQAWLGEREPVIAMHINGDAKAYPLQILMWHEIANDSLAGVPIAVTFCPLCNSALAFDRRLPLSADQRQALLERNPDAKFEAVDANFLAAYERQEGGFTEDIEDIEVSLVSFGVSGVLYNSNMLMFDTVSSSLWSQLLGVASVGQLSGLPLLRYPAPIVSFSEFQEAFPEGQVLSQDTGYDRRYGNNPYVGYDDIDSPAFLFNGVSDGRLSPKERVVSVIAGDASVAYPFGVLEQEQIVHDDIAERKVVIFWQAGTNSSLDTRSIQNGKDVGAVGIFERTIDGQSLDFRLNDTGFEDEQTGSTWNILGMATSGPLEGRQLSPIVHDNTLWFAWAAFKPDTRVYGLE